jgi:hypothetical protein
MAPARDSLVIDRPPGWPAWLVSLAIHASMLIALLFWIRNPPVRGAVDEPAREVGIALKQRTNDGLKFESPDFTNDDRPPGDQPLSNTAPQSDPTLAALPSPAEIPSSRAALPQLPTLGPGALTQDQSGDIGQMTSGGAASKRIGSKATVSVFGIAGTGTRFVYVFDRSISMAGPPLRAAKQQLINSLAALDTVHQFQIIFFNHEPQAWDLTGGQGRIAFATAANKQLAKQFVQNTTATGGTFRRTALQLALRLRPDVIFFLTDTDDPMASRDLTEAIERAQRDAIAINTIEYGSGVASPGESFLVQLARATGGRYVYVDTQALAR